MSIQTIKDNSQGLVAKIIVGLIVLTFALFGADAIIGYNSNSQKAASVNGEDISELTLLRASDFVKRQMLSEMGENADPDLISDKLVRSRALNELIERQIMVQTAQEQGISVSDERINEVIRNNENFQTNGVFDPAAYEFTLRNLQMTPRDYKAEVSRDALIQQPQFGLLLSAFVTQPEIDLLTRIDRQRRDFSYLVVPARELAADVVINDAEVQSYYDTNQSNYMTEEQLNIEYIELKQSDFTDGIDINEADIEELFAQETAELADQEERRASHILIGTENRSSEEAEALIAEIQQKLADGEDFGVLAKAHSDDPGSAENDGDLGFFGKNAFVPAFEETLFALNKGQVSDIVDTEFGLHLIRLDDIRAPETPMLANERDRLIETLRFQKAEEQFLAATENLQNDSFSAADLNEPAQNQNLSIKTSDFFNRKSGQGLTGNEKVRRIAFSDELLTEGNNSDLIEIAKDHVIVIRAKEHKPSKPRVYEDVAESIRSELVVRTAQQNAQKLGEQILVEIRDGKTLEQASKDYGYGIQTFEKAGRVEPSINAEVLREIFTVAKPVEGAVASDSLITTTGDFVVMVLNGVTEGNAEDVTEQEITMVKRFMTEQVATQGFEEFLNGVRESADIEKF